MNVKIQEGGFSMKKAIHAFLKVSFILSIILLAVGVIYIPLAFVTNDEATRISCIVCACIFVPIGIFDLVGSIIIRKKWPLCKSKAEAKPLAIFAIIVGALCTEFALAAGILMLALPEERYKEE